MHLTVSRARRSAEHFEERRDAAGLGLGAQKIALTR
jgi:hypothetical protein